MAVRNAAHGASTSAHAKKLTWSGLLNTDTGDHQLLPFFNDRSVQVLGTFGAGGEVSLEGSNDGGTTWAILSDPLGNALTFSAAGLKAISEYTERIRPNVTGGDGTTDLIVVVFMRGS
jgi:hypothetical protein